MSSSPPETRPATLDDADAVAEVLRAFETAIIGHPVSSAAELSAGWSFADLPTGSWLVERDGRLDAVAWVARRSDAWECFLASRPGNRELEPLLLDLSEGRVREAGGEQLRVPVFSVDEDGGALLAGRGYRPVRHFYEMRIELNGTPPEREWPDGIRPAAFRPEDARAFYDAANEAFADEWGFEPMPYEQWKRLRVEEADTSMYFIAWDGDEIAGYARCDAERGDTGWVGMIGVRPAWRRRGIGEALLRHAFAEFQRRGLHAAALGVDAENPTGATRLYERVGMHVASEDVIYERTLG